MARAVGDFDLAVAHGRQGVALLRSAGNPRALAAALNGLGAAYTEQGDLDAARQAHEESLALKRAVGDRNGAAVSLVNLGLVALAQARYADTKPLEAEALAIFRETGYPMGEAVALNNLGTAHYLLGEYAEAKPLLQECLTLCRELGHRYIAAYTLANLGVTAGGLGDFPAAWQYTREALQMAAGVKSISATLLALVGAARLLAKQGAPERAAEVAALVGQHPAANHETKGRAAELLTELAAALPAPALVAAEERGRARALDAVAGEVLAWAAAQVGVQPP
jgi:tetratricopeptide (TPR) repeat protein